MEAERTVELKDGRTVELRRVRGTDAPGVLELERALVEDGRGMVVERSDLAEDEVAQLRKLRPWLGPSYEGVYWVAAGPPGGPAILAQGELRRLAPRRVRHVGMLSIGVHPVAQGCGLGTAMMEALLDWGGAHEMLRIELYVRSSNERARHLYERFGFEVEGRRPGFIRTDTGFEDDLVMGRFRPGGTPPAGGGDPLS